MKIRNPYTKWSGIYLAFSIPHPLSDTQNDSFKPFPCCLVTFLSVSAIKLGILTAKLWCRNLIFLTTSVPYHASWFTLTLVPLYNRQALRIVKTSRAENTTWTTESVSLCTDVMRKTLFAPCPTIVNANNKINNKYDKLASMGDGIFMQNFNRKTNTKIDWELKIRTGGSCDGHLSFTKSRELLHYVRNTFIYFFILARQPQ